MEDCADLRRLESAMSFMTLCGTYSSISTDWLKPMLTRLIEKTYKEPMATSSSRSRRGGRSRGVVVRGP